jgi:two-component system sensor kinase FixL
MASSIAHEINQPLTSISLFSISGKTLLSRGQIERMPEIFDKLSKHSKRAGAIIQRMQNMARSHKNVKELANCNDLVNEIIEFADADARSRQIKINLQLADTLPAVMVDQIQIQQVILNLVRNGMEAIELAKGCLDKSITITTSLSAAGQVKIAVIDNGTGVSKLAKNTLFEAFSSTKTSSMGVGLSISKAIIEAHGGHLGFFNNDTVGATFYFSIPVANSLLPTT